ncbi:MAG: ABC transporter substrate-binding protein [Sandaracinaceae bacterium]|nr:ABC transporter substrate-binding protein [Sandaracinaceae bacterium]
MRTLFLVVAISAVGCAPQATLPPDTFDPIKIGVVTSLSGTLGTDGPGWERAARLAAREINAAGGPLPGRPIELVVLDDATNPANAEALAQRLIEEDVVGIVGAAASNLHSLPALPCPRRSRRSRAARRPISSRRSTRTSPIPRGATSSAPRRPTPCSRWWWPSRPRTSAACASPSSTSTTTTASPSGSGSSRPSGRAGAPWPSASPSPTSSPATRRRSLRCATRRLTASRSWPSPVSGGLIVRDWANLGATPEVTWIGTDGVRAPGFVEEAGDPALIDGFYGTSPITDPASPAYNDFAARYRAVFGSAPIPFSANQYDAVALLALAIAQAGTTDGPAVRDALRLVSSPPAERGFVRAGQLVEGLADIRAGDDIDYDGASGNTDFDALGNVITPYEIWRYDAPGTTPCPQATLLAQGSFCRFRTLNAADIRP